MDAVQEAKRSSLTAKTQEPKPTGPVRELAPSELTVREQLAQAQSGLKNLRAEHETFATILATLQKIEITNPRFAYQERQASISFSIANNGNIPVKRIFGIGKLQTPSRWIERDFNYEFPSGLKPKERQNLTLTPNLLSNWGQLPADAVCGHALVHRTCPLLTQSGHSVAPLSEGRFEPIRWGIVQYLGADLETARAHQSNCGFSSGLAARGECPSPYEASGCFSRHWQ